MPPNESYYKQLLERYLKNDVSPEEADELFAFIREQPADAARMLEESGGEDYIRYVKSQAHSVEDAISDRMLERVLKTIAGSADKTGVVSSNNPFSPAGEPRAKRVRFLQTAWFRYAAAAVIVLAVSTAVVLLHPGKKAAVATAQNDVLPGGNKAVLTLANGRQIILDSAHTGTLAQQGNAEIIKTDSGKLAYTIIHGKPADVVYNVLTTPRGGQYKIRLPDGTDVWLNSASSIRYPTAFVSGVRKVEITGEVYFEVVKDKAKPFHVKVNDMDVAVLGTHFNINSYADEGSIKTTLLEGSVKVSRGNDESAILKPGQQAIAASSVRQLKSKAVGLTTRQRLDQIKVVYDPNIEQVMAWKNGYFSFNQADLITVLRQLERWYDIEVKYAGDAPVRHFKGELSRDLTLSQVISVLAEMDVKFKIEGRTLTVMP